MKGWIGGLVVALAVAGGAMVVAAQDGAVAVLQPLAIDVVQEMPVEVAVIVPIDGGEPVTATTTLTVGIALRVTIQGADVVSVVPLGEQPATVAVSELGGSATDQAGRVVEVETPAAVEVLQLQSGESSMGLTVIGELHNAGDTPLEYVKVLVSLYDAAGVLLDVDATYADVDVLSPGGTSPFKLMTSLAPESVARYRVQVTQ